jgi:hypothetical protein
LDTTKLGELAQLLRSHGERALRARYPVPVLLVSAPTTIAARVKTPTSGNSRSETTVPLGATSEEGCPSRETQRQSPGASSRTSLLDPTQLVMRLIKSERNPFSGVITVGRAKSNDVVIESPEVSKVHAWIHPRGDGFTLSDNGSTNGTFVSSVRLLGKEEAGLQPGVAIRFGPVGCRLVTTDDLVEYCAAIPVGP